MFMQLNKKLKAAHTELQNDYDTTETELRKTKDELMTESKLRKNVEAGIEGLPEGILQLV